MICPKLPAITSGDSRVLFLAGFRRRQRVDAYADYTTNSAEVDYDHRHQEEYDDRDNEPESVVHRLPFELFE